jgi:LysR family transcriptional regulator, hydrogen peroxide-inducible genes activator
MNIKDLKYLVAIAELSSFRLAAERCFVSQPTLSMQLKKLEKELGVQCFERTNKAVMLTSNGAKLVKQAKLILHEVDNLTRISANLKDPLAGEFTLGMIQTVCPYMLPELLPCVKRSLPKLDLLVVEGKTDALLAMLADGELDAVILALPIDSDKFVIRELFTEEFYLAVPNDHALADRKKIRLNDLENEPLLLLEEGHCLREQALDVCQFAGVKEYTGFHATSLDTLTRLVESGAGITLLPQMAASSCHADIKLKSFARPLPSRSVGMVWRSQAVRKLCCEALANILSSA